jgi:hypothetical protein
LGRGIIGGKTKGQGIGIKIIIIDKENAEIPITIIGTGSGVHLEIRALLIEEHLTNDIIQHPEDEIMIPTKKTKSMIDRTDKTKN